MTFQAPVTSQQFERDIEQLVSRSHLSYIDAIIAFCEQRNIEVEVIASLIKSNQSLKAKLYAQCQDLNLVEKLNTLTS